MAEMVNYDEIPGAINGNGGQTQKEPSVEVFDHHMPTFDFDGYPDMDDDNQSSPRIVDDTWKKYEV